LGVLISVLIAAAVALLLPEAVLQLQPLLAPAFALTMILVIMVVVAANRERLAETGPFLMAALVTLNLSAYGVAWLAGRWLGWPSAQRRTLVIEVGMQNAGLGSVLAMAHLGHAAAIPSAFYTALCVLTAAMGLPLRRRWAGSQGVVDKSPWDL
jgi:BASS family bile acid:Na+ symporter